MGSLGGSQPVRALVRKTSNRSRAVERRAQRAEKDAKLEMRDDVRGGKDLEAEDPRPQGPLHPRRGQRAVPLLGERLVDPPRDLDQVRARAGRRVEHEHLVVGQAVGDAQLGAEQLIDPPDHVLDDLRRGVPDAQFLAQLRDRTPEETARRRA